MGKAKKRTYKKARKGLSKKARVYLGTGLFLLFGCAAMLLGFGWANGWDYVIKWFGSRWAVCVYICAFFYLVGAVYLWWWNRMGAGK